MSNLFNSIAAFAHYLTLDWTSEGDECENNCGVTMDENNFNNEGDINACSRQCSEDHMYCEDDGIAAAERAFGC